METPDELKSNPEVRQLKAEISETQAELQQTVAEIQDRLSPAHLKHQAADSVREAATNVREQTIGRVQHMVRGQNPIPFALIGIGAAWLLASNRSSRRWNDSEYSEYDSSWSNSTSHVSSQDEFASPYSGELGSGHAYGSPDSTGRAHEARRRAAELGNQARDRARRVASRARSRWDTMLQDNPMALGIAALAAGAMVGAALPRTEVEDDYLGETRDNLIESARSMAHDSVDTAKTMAKEAVEKVAGGDSTSSSGGGTNARPGSEIGRSTSGREYGS